MTVPHFTPEQLYDQAQGNQTAFILGTIAFFKEQHYPIEEWVESLGNQFTPGWEQLEGQGAKAALEAAVLNFLSGGGSLHSFSGDESRAEAVITDWPSSDLLKLFGLTQEDVDPFYAIFNPIGAYLHLQFTWHREGNRVSFTFTR